MQVLKLCKLAYFCFEMIFQNVICSVISKQLKTPQLSFYMQMLYFIILNHFQQIKY